MAIAIEAITTLLTLAGLAYLLLALWGTRNFVHYWRRKSVDAGFAPPKFPQLHESEDDRGKAGESDISCRHHDSQQRHSGAQTEKNCDPNELTGGHVANADPRVRVCVNGG